MSPSSLSQAEINQQLEAQKLAYEKSIENYYNSLTSEQKKQLLSQYNEEDYTLIIQLPRQDKQYYMKKLGLITYPEDIENLAIIVQKKTINEQELDDEQSLMEASKYTKFINQCSNLRKFSFTVEYQQQFMDYSDLLFYSLESRDIQEIALCVRGLSKSKDTLSKILKSVRTFKYSIQKLKIQFNDIFLNDDSFNQLFLLIKKAPKLQELEIELGAKFFIQLERVFLFCKILETATQLKKVSLKFSKIDFLKGTVFDFQQGNIQILNLDFVEAKLFDNTFITQLITNNNYNLKDVHLRVNATNSIEDIFISLYHLPQLLKLHFESPKYFQEDQVKIIKNFISKKSSIMYFSINLSQKIDFLYDKSARILKNLPNLCAFREISDVKFKRTERVKKMLEYFISRFIRFRRTYIYSLIAIKELRKKYRKILPKGVWEDLLNDFVTFEDLEQLIDKTDKSK
ncbi:hypothetical protein TTHERM_00721180 (macronuclear) [Tetrahymena thermophila SB210]|uniref:Uncharacterized protein n=1 Tax=Tetrahymena thermophila (strain SB210) TaxID=312017 RepID=Q22G39_TETTS|nr:hypothetical protein TTHERM_00721180 [Tetrahymena thermophila SB210]EAR84187.1 hypothetical protein TTHERM_00721180 [Tetrahymena thermophila SB210]|eukprot:XP_001031850.1 hypothetical protein TTHERM_00721180 [Tetrahymena thermophila SB210]